MYGFRPLALDDAALSTLLREDAPHGDLTTHILGIGRRPARMTFAARGPQVVSCVEEAARMIELSGGRIDFCQNSGTRVEDGELLLDCHGPAASLLLAWKVAQTMMEYTAGVASTTSDIAAAAREAVPAGKAPAVACTRKTFPGTRALAARAVLDGGGAMHRLGLSETVLVFPEHAVFFAGEDLAEVLQAARRHIPEKRLVIEVGTPEAARQAALAGADVVQLEKFPPADIAAFAAWKAEQKLPVVIAAAGGIKPDNAASYARAGAEVLVTSWPYFAPPRDVKVTISPAGTA